MARRSGTIAAGTARTCEPGPGPAEAPASPSGEADADADAGRFPKKLAIFRLFLRFSSSSTSS